jgi:1-acyl-sn-glycerol-3-phosphate acyltransferase
MGKRLHVTGKEHFRKDHKYIVLANHASLFDIPAIMAVFSRVSWLGKEVLMKIPLFGQALKTIDYIPVPRPLTSGGRKIINDSIKNAGDITVSIFPEGTRTLDGGLQEFKRGFILILKGTELDVVPVTLNGMFALKPKKRFSINPFVRLEMIIHEPIANSALRDKSNDEILKITRSVIAEPYTFTQ